MKVIYAGRAEGKTSYILKQCEKLEGRKLIIVSTTIEAVCLKNKLYNSGNEDLKAVDVYSTYEIFVKNKTRGLIYSYVFIDEMQTVLQYALNSKLLIDTEFRTERIFATLAKECMVDLDDIRPKISCEACTHKQVCRLASTFNEKYCIYYEEKQ